MQTNRIEEFLQRLKTSQLDAADFDRLERVTAEALLAEIAFAYPWRFQQRRLGNKWEAGLARSMSYLPLARRANSRRFPILILVPAFHDCLFLSGEGEAITGVSRSPRLIVKPIRTPFAGLALSTAAGMKVDRTPDGWEIKPLQKRTVKLSEELLEKRGWCFDATWQHLCDWR